MEHKEQLNPESEDNKKKTGEENLNATDSKDQQTSTTETETDAPVNQQPQVESEAEKKKTEATEEDAADNQIGENKVVEDAPPVSDKPDAEVEASKKEDAPDEPIKDESARVEEESDTSEAAPIVEKKEAEVVEEPPAPKTSEGVVDDAPENKTAGNVVEEVPEEKVVEEKPATETVEETLQEDTVDSHDETSAPPAAVLGVVESVALEKEQQDTPAGTAPDEEDDEEVAARYAAMSKEALVETVEALVQHDDVNHIRKHIGFIKASFRKVLKEENIASFEKNLDVDQESAEGQEVAADPLVERFDAAFTVYKDKKSVYDQALEKQKHDNLAAKEAILEELRHLIESEEELKKTYDQFHALQERWRQIGQVPQNAKSTLWNNYHFLVEKFFDKVKINKELKDLDLKKNLEAKTELCEKAEELLLETSITRSFQRLQKLHEAWKEIGPVPNDKKDEIWDRFKAATDKLNKRRQEHYDGLREEQNKNYAAKVVLCEKAEELAARTPDSPRKWQDLTNQINELFSVWKTIGFAPKKVNNEVWNRFRSSLDTFFRNKKEFFNKYKEQQTENYNQKLNLCMQAEVLKESDDWRRTTDELIALQKEWKKIGPVPSKYSDKIWKRFRAACDEFFEKKSKYFSNIGEQQDDNLRKKQELIEKVRNHPYTENNNENLEVLKNFQREWMDIGHVPIKQKDKIQNEFRKAIDEQFEKLKLSKKVKNTLSFRSKIDNLKNAPNAENIIYKERNFLLNKISGLQNDIKLWENNIGFFASSKKADVLKAEFEEKIEKARQEIAIMEEKLKILRDA
jgi:hypothetical protein